jgi:hypothetical protein
VKVTVIDRSAQVVERQGVVVLALRSMKPPTLPKGLPPLPNAPTNYMVFIQQKQWNKVCTVSDPRHPRGVPTS